MRPDDVPRLSSMFAVSSEIYDWWHEAKDRAGIVDDILAGSFPVRQSKSILARSGEAGPDFVNVRVHSSILMSRRTECPGVGCDRLREITHRPVAACQPSLHSAYTRRSAVSPIRPTCQSQRHPRLGRHKPRIRVARALPLSLPVPSLFLADWV